MQNVRNSEGELVSVLDAQDFEAYKAEQRAAFLAAIRTLIGWCAGIVVSLLLPGAIWALRAGDQADRTETALVAHLEEATKRDENLTAILRMTDSMRIEMRHLTNAIKGRPE